MHDVPIGPRTSVHWLRRFIAVYTVVFCMLVLNRVRCDPGDSAGAGARRIVATALRHLGAEGLAGVGLERLAGPGDVSPSRAVSRVAVLMLTVLVG